MRFALLPLILAALIALANGLRAGSADDAAKSRRDKPSAAEPKKSAPANRKTQKSEASGKAAGNATRNTRRPLEREQVERVQAFVRKQMPELENLLAALEKNQPNRYANAIRELYVAAERLERLRQRDEESYALALRVWQLDKKAQLLAARMRMDESEDASNQLRQLLEKRYRLEIEIRERNRDRQAARLRKIEEDLARLRANRETAVQRQLRELLKTKTRKAGAGRAGKRAKQP